MNRKTLTPDMLRKIVLEEMAKLHEEKKLKSVEDKAKETKELKDGGDYADTLASHIDMLKALKVEETKLRLRLKSLDERKQKLIRKISE